MADSNPTPQPGTKAYAGARADKRDVLLKEASERLGRGRGEGPLVAKLAALTNALIEHYDLDADMTESTVLAATEQYFGILVARMNEIADARDSE